MKQIMEIRTTIALTSIWLLISNSPGATPSLESHVITPGVGLGPIKLGMKRAGVIKEFGEPTRKPNENTFQYSESIGITFDRADRVAMIACGWWCFGETVEAQTHPFKGRLSNGTAMGASKAQVREKLGSPAKIRVVDEQQAFESWHYPAQGAILSFKLDALSHVAVVPKKADAATSVYIFGPQWEREMRPEDARYLDLDTGQFVAAHPPGDLFHWSAESSLQARAGANMVAIPVQDLKWETADPGELIELVSKATPQHQVRLGGGKSAILDDPIPGRTWVFKTSEGNTGILQISENSQRPGSVVIRFKLVQRE